MEESKINQIYRAYYPPELDENLCVVTQNFSLETEKQQKTHEKTAQNAQKSEFFDGLSKIMSSAAEPELLSKIMAIKSGNIGEIASLLSKSGGGKNGKIDNFKPPRSRLDIEEL